MEALLTSPFFGVSLSIFAFWAGTLIQKKTKLMIANPLLIAIALIIGFLQIFHIPYESYNIGGSLINMLLLPATACLSVSIYAKRKILKENLIPILVGCTCGSIASMGCVFALCKLFHLEDAMTYALLPKSVTTAIAMGISASHGGYVSITVVAVICTGILGNILAPVLIRLFRVDDPMTAGLAIGSCSHAIGTTRALSLGETEGAMSGLAIGICGIITVILSLFI